MVRDSERDLRKEVSTMKSRMVGRDFLTLMDFSKEEIEYILDTATELKRLWSMKVPHEYLRGRTIACLFEKHSTRTRTSFQAGIAHLGAQSFYMRSDELQLAAKSQPKTIAIPMRRSFRF